MEAARDIGSKMKAVTIPRIVAQYHDDAVAGNPIASATGIRKSFFESDTLGAITDFMPRYSTRNLTRLASGKSIIRKLVDFLSPAPFYNFTRRA